MIKWEPDLVPGLSWDTYQDWGKKPGMMAGRFSLPSLPVCPSEQARECTLMSGVQASRIPSVSFPGPNSLGDYPSQYQTPGQGHPVCAFTCSLPGEDLCPCNL